MSDMPTTLIPTGARGTPETTAVIESLAHALRGRSVPPPTVFATGRLASPEEGLALVQSLLAIKEPVWRQALLDAAAALAAPPLA